MRVQSAIRSGLRLMRCTLRITPGLLVCALAQGAGATSWHGPDGKPQAFDGRHSLTLPDSAQLDLPDGSPWTIEAWVFRTGPSLPQHVAGKRGVCGSGQGFYQIAIDHNGPGRGMSVEPANAPLNTWTQVVIVGDGSLGWTVYADGVPVKTVRAPRWKIHNNAPFRIGAAGTCAPFVGLIDEVSVYNRALLPQEVRSGFLATRAAHTMPTLASLPRREAGIRQPTGVGRPPADGPSTPELPGELHVCLKGRCATWTLQQGQYNGLWADAPETFGVTIRSFTLQSAEFEVSYADFSHYLYRGNISDAGDSILDGRVFEDGKQTTQFTAYWGRALSRHPASPNDQVADQADLLRKADRFYDYDRFAAALPLYQRLANAGNTHAMERMGRYYALGNFVKQDSAEALRWYHRADDAGSKDAAALIGPFYEDGDSVPKDREKAIAWYQKGVAAGDTDAMLRMGNLYCTRDSHADANQAIGWYRRAFEAGDVRGAGEIGELYASGYCMPADYREAISWLEKGIAKHDGVSMAVLGMLTEYGRGVQQSDAEAMEWYRKAIQNGDAEEAGPLLHRIKLRTQKPTLGVVQVFHWVDGAGADPRDPFGFARSCSNGNEEACSKRDYLTSELSGEWLADNDSCDEGDKGACLDRDRIGNRLTGRCESDVFGNRLYPGADCHEDDR